MAEAAGALDTESIEARVIQLCTDRKMDFNDIMALVSGEFPLVTKNELATMCNSLLKRV